jgi:ribosomal protein S18 acetylase RimI-like enzyme
MAEPTLRPASPADAPLIAAVHVRSWRSGYRGIVADSVLEGLSVAEYERNWLEWLGGEETTTVVATADAALAGFATTAVPSRDADATADTAELVGLYVDPDHWRGGFGRALLLEAMARSRAHGCREMTAWVLERNAAAIAFYARFGFIDDGARRGHARSGRQALRVRAPLTF